MNRLIMCIAFLVTAQAMRAMEHEPNEKIKIGAVNMYLSAHVVQAIVYDDAPLNNVCIYRCTHEKLVNKGKLGSFTEEEKWKVFDEIDSKNYIFVSGAEPKLVLINSNQIEAFYVPATNKSLEKKPSLRRTLSFWEKKKK